jgi:hypothetical protein
MLNYKDAINSEEEKWDLENHHEEKMCMYILLFGLLFSIILFSNLS